LVGGHTNKQQKSVFPFFFLGGGGGFVLDVKGHPSGR